MTTPLTWLYVPGDRPDRFGRAVASGADVVILDLEDAVAQDAKDAARDHVAAYLSDPSTARPGEGPALHVRVNDLTGSRGRADLAAVAGLPRLASVRLPKVESTSVLDLAADAVGAGRAHALVESAAGLLALPRITTHPAVAGVALGEQDLRAGLGLTAESALDSFRLSAVVAAAAAGIEPVAMAVFPHVRDLDGLRESCRHGRALGMVGRTAIHPDQLPVIREAFAPSQEELAWARRVVEAAGEGAVGALALDDGTFVDEPVLRRARALLATAGGPSGA